MSVIGDSIYNAAMAGEPPIHVLAYGPYYQYLIVIDQVSINGSYFFVNYNVNVNGENVNFPPLIAPNGLYFKDEVYQCFTLSTSDLASTGHFLSANRDCIIDFILIGGGGSGGLSSDNQNTAGGGGGAILIGSIQMNQNDSMTVIINGVNGIDTINYQGNPKPLVGRDLYHGNGGNSTLNINFNNVITQLIAGGGVMGVGRTQGDGGRTSISNLTQRVVIEGNFAGSSGGLAVSNGTYGLAPSAELNTTNVFDNTVYLPSGGAGGGVNTSMEYNQYQVDGVNSLPGVGMAGGGYGDNIRSPPKNSAWLPGGGGGGMSIDSTYQGFGGKGVVMCIIRY